MENIKPGYLRIEETETIAEKFTNEKNIASNLPPEKLSNTSSFYTLGGISKNAEASLLLEGKLRSDISLLISTFENTYYRSFIQAIKNYTLTTLDRAIELYKKRRTWMTNVKQPIIRTYVDRLVQSIFTTNFSIKTYPLSKKNIKKAKAVQSAIEWCFSSSKAKRALFDMGVSAILQGVGFARTGFNVSKEKIKEMKNPDKKMVYPIEDVYAEFDWVSEFCIFGEPFTPFYEQRFLVYRKVLPMKSILKRLKTLDTNITDDHIRTILKRPKPISYKNFDKVRTIKYYQDYYLIDESFNIDNIYQVKMDNDHCEYIEYRTEDNLLIIVNGYIVYDGKNPLPKGIVHPFKCINFTRLPGVWISDGVGTLLEKQQMLYDGLYNLSFDLVKFSAGPMFLLQPGQSIEDNEKVLNYEPYTFKQVRGPGKIETLQLPTLDPSVVKTMQDILQMADFAISPSSYNQLQGVSRSATDSQLRYEGLKDSVRQLITSMNEMLTYTAEHWIKEMKIKMPSEFEIPIFDDLGRRTWETIKLKDLSGKYIFERESDSIKDANKIVERAQLGELVQFLSKLGTDPVTGRWLVDNEKLMSTVLELYNAQEALLSKEDYLRKVKESKELLEKVQSQLGEATQQQAENVPQNMEQGVQQGVSQGMMQNMQPQEQGGGSAGGSPYASGEGLPEEQRIAEEEMKGYDLASVFKAALE